MPGLVCLGLAHLVADPRPYSLCEASKWTPCLGLELEVAEWSDSAVPHSLVTVHFIGQNPHCVAQRESRAAAVPGLPLSRQLWRACQGWLTRSTSCCPRPTEWVWSSRESWDFPSSVNLRVWLCREALFPAAPNPQCRSGAVGKGEAFPGQSAPSKVSATR